MVYAILRNELWEMTPASARSSGAKIIHWSRAHEWVKANRVHNTALWVNEDGKIRRAERNC